MTVDALYKYGLTALKNEGIDNFGFENDLLFEKAVGLNHIKRIINLNSEVEISGERIYNEYILRRISGEPLQYILGSWEFMGMNFSVGEGVLIPRPETELLVEKANEFISKNNSKIIFDLCAGSGAVGLSLAKLNPECKVFLFEKYDGALKYLKINAEELKLVNVSIIKYDIFNGYNNSFSKPDIIVSNPPYIKTDEISGLQKEVLYEPSTALDGGNDGLAFYRCIIDKWLGNINPDGAMLAECSDNQSNDIFNLFNGDKNNFTVYYDFNNIDRVIHINV